jgi:hypothetical protein
MIATGRCGITRDLEWYENPFDTNLVFLGNMGFVLLIMLFLTSIGYCVEQYKPDNRGDIISLMTKYKAVDIGFLLLLFFTSPVFASFLKFNKSAIEVMVVFAGGTSYFFAMIALWKEVSASGIARNSISETLTDELYEWSGIPRILKPIVQGYTSKMGLYTDLAMTFIISCSTLSNDCYSLGIITVVMNSVYSIYILWKKPIQPILEGYSSIVFSVSQSACILLIMNGGQQTVAIVVNYVGSIIGSILFVLPGLRCPQRPDEQPDLSSAGSSLLEIFPIDTKETETLPVGGEEAKETEMFQL